MRQTSRPTLAERLLSGSPAPDDLGQSEAPKDIAFAVTEKKAEPRTARIGAILSCRIWRTDEQERRNFQAATEDVMKNNDCVLLFR